MQNSKMITATLVLLTAVATTAFDILPKELGNFYLGQAAFLEVFQSEQATENYADQFTLYISNFNPLSLAQKDYIYYIKSPGSQLNDVNNWVPTKIDQENYWPNDLYFMSSSIAGREGIIWTSGFLVPTKTKGCLNIYFTDQEPFDGPYNIASLDDQDYSYHRIIWRDVNGDGLSDAVTARFHTGLLGSVTKQFLWLENPGNSQLEGWTQHMINEDGADIHFQIEQLPVGGTAYDVQLNGEFWNEKVTIYYGTDNANFWQNPSVLQEVVVDDTIGQPFDLYYWDINLDGVKEIIVTAYNGSYGNVFAYTVPEDFRTGTFERHTLAEGFEANFILGGQSMTPGAAHLFYISDEHEQSGEKPYILLSGDDDGKHYILTAASQDKNDWSYEKNVYLDTKATTTGKSVVADLDGDGKKEIVAAAYSAGRVYVYTYGDV
ncbi:uncharacterized protein LOC124596225 isoform X1 [Schistocerca americana]|uniref:uncharacterized protein LOC124596225 isoform X1 n=1 Tax=Schistocerca americana TaxID=7009 RepID=UPI001F502547|nr:uncharacterized protein LOC124596225 isoform X1 [Schistocerca americana]